MIDDMGRINFSIKVPMHFKTVCIRHSMRLMYDGHGFNSCDDQEFALLSCKSVIGTNVVLYSHTKTMLYAQTLSQACPNKLRFYTFQINFKNNTLMVLKYIASCSGKALDLDTTNKIIFIPSNAEHLAVPFLVEWSVFRKLADFIRSHLQTDVVLVALHLVVSIQRKSTSMKEGKTKRKMVHDSFPPCTPFLIKPKPNVTCNVN